MSYLFYWHYKQKPVSFPREMYALINISNKFATQNLCRKKYHKLFTIIKKFVNFICFFFDMMSYSLAHIQRRFGTLSDIHWHSCNINMEATGISETSINSCAKVTGDSVLVRDYYSSLSNVAILLSHQAPCSQKPSVCGYRLIWEKKFHVSTKQEIQL